MKTIEGAKDEAERRRLNEAGGPAFPSGKPLDGWGDPNQGMTLRDWFAGQALGLMMKEATEAMCEGQYDEGLVDQLVGQTARMSYRFADAMIKARKK